VHAIATFVLERSLITNLTYFNILDIGHSLQKEVLSIADGGPWQKAKN